MSQAITQLLQEEWVTFKGGELEGKRPNVLCPACREQLKRVVAGAAGHRRSHALCFHCYRVDLERERSLRRAGELDTASDKRFQSVLPFEPVNRARLDALKAERAASRTAMMEGAGRFVDKRRHAQIAARHALQRVASGFPARAVAASRSQEGDRAWASAVHAAELQLPESWLPFVVSH